MRVKYDRTCQRSIKIISTEKTFSLQKFAKKKHFFPVIFFQRVQLGKILRITRTQGENKHGDPIFLLHFWNVLYMADICIKFIKKKNSLRIVHHFQVN